MQLRRRVPEIPTARPRPYTAAAIAPALAASPLMAEIQRDVETQDLASPVRQASRQWVGRAQDRSEAIRSFSEGLRGVPHDFMLHTMDTVDTMDFSAAEARIVAEMQSPGLHDQLGGLMGTGWRGGDPRRPRLDVIADPRRIHAGWDLADVIHPSTNVTTQAVNSEVTMDDLILTTAQALGVPAHFLHPGLSSETVMTVNTDAVIPILDHVDIPETPRMRDTLNEVRAALPQDVLRGRDFDGDTANPLLTDALAAGTLRNPAIQGMATLMAQAHTQAEDHVHRQAIPTTARVQEAPPRVQAQRIPMPTPMAVPNEAISQALPNCEADIEEGRYGWVCRARLVGMDYLTPIFNQAISEGTATTSDVSQLQSAVLFLVNEVERQSSKARSSKATSQRWIESVERTGRSVLPGLHQAVEQICKKRRITTLPEFAGQMTEGVVTTVSGFRFVVGDALHFIANHLHQLDHQEQVSQERIDSLTETVAAQFDALREARNKIATLTAQLEQAEKYLSPRAEGGNPNDQHNDNTV